MKKVIIFFLIGTLCFPLLGCINDLIKLGKKSKYEISDNLVSMSIKEGTLTNISATVILVNHTDKKFKYGGFYSIEYKKNGDWYEIKPIGEMNFAFIAYVLNPNMTEEIAINWETAYGKLPSGDYRIIKIVREFNVDNLGRINNSEEIPIAAEFTIE
jgi:hypothetical protein